MRVLAGIALLLCAVLAEHHEHSDDHQDTSRDQHGEKSEPEPKKHEGSEHQTEPKKKPSDSEQGAPETWEDWLRNEVHDYTGRNEEAAAGSWPQAGKEFTPVQPSLRGTGPLLLDSGKADGKDGKDGKADKAEASSQDVAEAAREARQRAMAEVEKSEAQAASSVQDALNHLHTATAEAVIGKVSHWKSLQDLTSSSKPEEANKWEEALESSAEKLQQFNDASRNKTAADFDASRAAKLLEAVRKASDHVEGNAREQKHRIKQALKDARHRARADVKQMKREVKAAAKTWRFHGKRAVKAQKAARVPEHVWEGHEDRLGDGVGDAEDSAADAAEKLEEKVSEHFEKLEDDFADAGVGARGRELRRKARRAEEDLREVARSLGAKAQLKEALAAARFGKEEKDWRASKAPQELDEAAPARDWSGPGIVLVGLAALATPAAMALRKRMCHAEVRTPLLLG